MGEGAGEAKEGKGGGGRTMEQSEGGKELTGWNGGRFKVETERGTKERD